MKKLVMSLSILCLLNLYAGMEEKYVPTGYFKWAGNFYTVNLNKELTEHLEVPLPSNSSEFKKVVGADEYKNAFFQAKKAKSYKTFYVAPAVYSITPQGVLTKSVYKTLDSNSQYYQDIIKSASAQKVLAELEQEKNMNYTYVQPLYRHVMPRR